MIKELHLINFQRHSDLKLDFQKGINLITGSSDVGKSAIVRSLRFCLFNDFSGNEARKKGTKETIVTVIFDNGWKVSKLRGNTTNAYIIKKGDIEKRFDSVGKDIPEEVQKIINISMFDIEGQKINLNVAHQFEAPFLIGKEYSSIFRAKLFNILTGNDLQDKVFKELNKDILRIGRDLTSTKETLESNKKDIETIEVERNTLEDEYNELDNNLSYINHIYETYNTYLQLQERFIKNSDQLKSAKESLKNIKSLPEKDIDQIRDAIPHLNRLISLQDAYYSISSGLNDARQALKEIVVPSIDFAEIYDKIDYLVKMQETAKKISSISTNIQVNKDKIKTITIEIKEDTEKLNELKKQVTVCPLCDKYLEVSQIEQLRKI